MAERDTPVTSDDLGRIMQTNPVVIRRIMAGLRDRGYVGSDKGHRGGWTLRRDLAEISLRDVHDALGSPALFALGHRDEHPACLVEQTVNTALKDSFDEAEALILARFEMITLTMLRDQFKARLAQRKSDGRFCT